MREIFFHFSSSTISKAAIWGCFEVSNSLNLTVNTVVQPAAQSCLIKTPYSSQIVAILVQWCVLIRLKQGSRFNSFQRIISQIFQKRQNASDRREEESKHSRDLMVKAWVQVESGSSMRTHLVWPWAAHLVTIRPTLLESFQNRVIYLIVNSHFLLF